MLKKKRTVIKQGLPGTTAPGGLIKGMKQWNRNYVYILWDIIDQWRGSTHCQAVKAQSKNK